jgi:hypothetical protein
LLLQSLRQIVRPLAQLVEQTRVLDGDDGLGSEVLDKLDLLVGERSDLLAVDDRRWSNRLRRPRCYRSSQARPAELQPVFDAMLTNAIRRCPRASASSRVRSSSCFFNSTSELGPLLTRVLTFVPVERSLCACVRLFALFRDKVTSSASSLVPSRPWAEPRIQASAI